MTVDSFEVTGSEVAAPPGPHQTRTHPGIPTTPLAGAPGLTLGAFLRDRRERASPGAGATRRRRTPGLRREEVAARAGVSVTWYTWLEQGRGGPPSEAVLERLAAALGLDATAREFLYLLAQQRPPPLACTPTSPVPASLQRVLDAMTTTPAIVRTQTWDVVAWNRAARAVLSDYAALPPDGRNVLRRIFGDAGLRASLPAWEEEARVAVAAFRVDAVRCSAAAALAAELEASSAEFRRLWAEHEVEGAAPRVKQMRHPDVGSYALEYSSFAVEGAPGLALVVFTPVRPEDARAVQRLVETTRLPD